MKQWHENRTRLEQKAKKIVEISSSTVAAAKEQFSLSSSQSLSKPIPKYLDPVPAEQV